MNVVEITRTDDLMGLAPVWNQALASSGSDNVHSTFEWLSTWWKHFGEDKQLLVILVKEDDRLLGIAPLMIESVPRIKKLLPHRTIRFLGEGPSDYADFIINGDKAQVIGLILDHLRKRANRWDEIDLVEIREDSPNTESLVGEAAKRGFNPQIISGVNCCYLPLNQDWETYFSSLDKRHKTAINRVIRKAGREEGGIEFVRKHPPEDLDYLMDKIVEIHRQRSQVKERASLFETKEAFVREAVSSFAERGWTDLSTLEIGGKVAAYSLGFDYQNVVYIWNVAFDPTYKSFAPGLLTFRFLIENCMNNGHQEFDFMRGEEPYKEEWTKLTRRNYRITMTNPAFRSRILKGLLRLGEMGSVIE
ncbi:MAG: GNAT family N-acetyltransferase [bacterium]